LSEKVTLKMVLESEADATEVVIEGITLSASPVKASSISKGVTVATLRPHVWSFLPLGAVKETMNFPVMEVPLIVHL